MGHILSRKDFTVSGLMNRIRGGSIIKLNKNTFGEKKIMMNECIRNAPTSIKGLVLENQIRKGKEISRARALNVRGMLKAAL